MGTAANRSRLDRKVLAGRPGKVTAKGRRTEAAFVEAARRVFIRDGYLNAKIADIAAEAGRSPGSFYNYFDSKAELLEVMAVGFHEEVQAQARSPYLRGAPPEAALTEAIAAFWFTYRKHLAELVGVFEASMTDADFYERWQAIRSDAIRTIARGIRQAKADGFCPGLDALIAASALSSMIEHFCYVWQAQGGDPLGVTLDDELAITTLSALWGHAIYWREASSPANRRSTSTPRS